MAKPLRCWSVAHAEDRVSDSGERLAVCAVREGRCRRHLDTTAFAQ
jgi:hypothetical protein